MKGLALAPETKSESVPALSADSCINSLSDGSVLAALKLRHTGTPCVSRQGTSSQYQFCYLDLVIWYYLSTNSTQIVRRQCCLDPLSGSCEKTSDPAPARSDILTLGLPLESWKTTELFQDSGSNTKKLQQQVSIKFCFHSTHPTGWAESISGVGLTIVT